MTKKELIDIIQGYPDDTNVIFEDTNFKDPDGYEEYSDITVLDRGGIIIITSIGKELTKGGDLR